MKKFKIFIFLNLIILILSSCGTVKEGFTNQRKNSSDEFLVEKKSPLVMPPNFGELPTPGTDSKKINLKENNIKDLIADPKNSENSNDDNNVNLEGTILGKIKNN